VQNCDKIRAALCYGTVKLTAVSVWLTKTVCRCERASPVPGTSWFSVHICERNIASRTTCRAKCRIQVYRHTERAVLTAHTIIQPYRRYCIDGTLRYTGLQNVLYWRHTSLYSPTEHAVLTAHFVIQPYRTCCIDSLTHTNKHSSRSSSCSATSRTIQRYTIDWLQFHKYFDVCPQFCAVQKGGPYLHG
jgi:hypothetical protein